MTDGRGVFIGLHSNVHFFASQQGFQNLDARVKALALVYDNLLFENGIYNCQIGEEGTFETVSPYGGNPADLKPVRTHKGSPLRVHFAPTGSDEWHTAIDTSTVKSYGAQFVTILKELQVTGVDWALVTSFTPQSPGYSLGLEADSIANEWLRGDADVLAQLEPDTPHYWRTALLKHLYTDLARAYLIGFDLAPDGRHARLLRRQAQAAATTQSASGVRTLSLLFPDIRRASWQDIDELRKDPGLGNLRSQLRECDAAGGSDQELLRRINERYRNDMEKYRPTWRSSAVSLLWNLASLIPGLGIMPTTIQSSMALTAAYGARRHWTASLMRLNSRVRR